MMPHLHCYVQEIALAWKQIYGSAAIGLAYVLFFIGVIRLIKLNLGLRSQWNVVILLTGAFILACGLGHFIECVTFFHPIYGLQAIWTWLTAVISWAALIGFFVLVRELPEVEETIANARKIEAENKELALELEQIRAFAEMLPQIAWTARADGFIDWYNHQWYDYTGQTPHSAMGWGWKSAHNEEFLPSVMERWEKSIETGEPFEMEFPLRGVDGTFRMFLTRVRPQRDENGVVVRWFGTNTDVQAHKDLQDKLTAETEMQTRSAEAAREALESVRDLRVRLEQQIKDEAK